jgi:phosphodiesterase/alkaline phosphatase D-like protein
VRRFPHLLAAAAALTIAIPATASGKGFTYGVAAGEVTSSSAVLWTRSDKAGTVRLDVSTDGDKRFGERGDLTKSLKAGASTDNTVQAKVTKLRPGKVFYYRFVKGSNASDVGRFKTAPASTRVQTVVFGLSGDADATPAAGQTKPFWNNFETYGRMAKDGNDFNVNLGDTIYSDSEVPSFTGAPEPAPALTVPEKWAKYKLNLALKNLQAIRRATGLYSHWDDHEFINDFSKAENGSAVYSAGVAAFRNYAPVTYTKSLGLYRKFRWGKNVELFFLDERSFRDAKADDACINPETGQPDLAPTAPPRTRNTFAVLVPSFSQPVSQQCLDTINSPDRTFLGKTQLARFYKDVAASTATFKVIVNELPIQMLYALPYDRWEGYEAERQAVLRYLQSKVENVVFLSTDVHANLINDARLKTLEDGGPVNTGIMDFSTGPVATRSFEKQIDNTTGKPGSGDAVEAAFFKPQPPDGLGMPCVNSDVFSYVRVTVSAKSLVVAPRDFAGKPLTEQDGSACGPFTITKK